MLPESIRKQLKEGDSLEDILKITQKYYKSNGFIKKPTFGWVKENRINELIEQGFIIETEDSLSYTNKTITMSSPGMVIKYLQGTRDFFIKREIPTEEVQSDPKSVAIQELSLL